MNEAKEIVTNRVKISISFLLLFSAGLNFVAQDVTQDGLTDIIISNFKGVFVFENKIKK